MVMYVINHPHILRAWSNLVLEYLPRVRPFLHQLPLDYPAHAPVSRRHERTSSLCCPSQRAFSPYRDPVQEIETLVKSLVVVRPIVILSHVLVVAVLVVDGSTVHVDPEMQRQDVVAVSVD